jgi:hypothetical protein
LFQAETPLFVVVNISQTHKGSARDTFEGGAKIYLERLIAYFTKKASK